MAEPHKKKAKTGRPLENVPLKTLVKRVMQELDQKKVGPTPVTAYMMKKS
jgi:hypothetical protein